MDTDIAIIGAGAAGLSAAIFAAEAARQSKLPLRITLLDRAKSPGAKILVSGGGRCNVTHDAIDPARDYNGSKNIVRNILAAFDVHATVAWFESLGVRLKREETGKLFPTTDSARTVLQALLDRCEDLGVHLLTNRRVTDLLPISYGFDVVHDHGTLRARRVIVATGGRSLPKTGSDGSFFPVLHRLGHTVTDTHPALVPLVVSPAFFHASLSGLALDAELGTFVDGKLADRRTGSLLFTHFGLSGPVAMDASRHWVIPHEQGKPVELRCNLIPSKTTESLDQDLLARIAQNPRTTLLRLLTDFFPDRLAGALAAHCALDPATPIGNLPREARRRLVQSITALVLPVEKDRGWNYAEVTAGGVPLNEIDYRTMHSRRVPNLYLIGELLDCDGRIGGFNFQWAWATAYIAGRASARPA